LDEFYTDPSRSGLGLSNHSGREPETAPLRDFRLSTLQPAAPDLNMKNRDMAMKLTVLDDEARATEWARQTLAAMAGDVGPADESGSEPAADQPLRRSHICAHYRGGLKQARVEDVIYLKADYKYVTVRHTDGELLVDESLRSLEREFADLFLRIHRNALVARARVERLERRPDGVMLLHLRDCPESLTVSRRHLPRVKRWMQEVD
jgi:two-component system response regulator AlgR